MSPEAEGMSGHVGGDWGKSYQSSHFTSREGLMKVAGENTSYQLYNGWVVASERRFLFPFSLP